MPADVLRLDLRLRRRSVVASTLGVAAYAFVIVALYPAFRHDSGLDQLSRSNPTIGALLGATGSLTSPAGWMNANLYTNVLPLFGLLLTIGYGASAIAGQDEEGTLGLVASLPLTRQQILLQKVVALVLLSVAVPVVCGVLTVVGRGYGVDLPTTALVETTVAAALMSLDFGLAALALGAWTGRRGTAVGVSAGVAAAAYVVSALSPVVDAVHRVRYASPLYAAVGAGQVHDGVAAAMWLVLVGLAVVLTAAAREGFRRADLH